MSSTLVYLAVLRLGFRLRTTRMAELIQTVVRHCVKTTQVLGIAMIHIVTHLFHSDHLKVGC